jgi:hypothetical protein
VNPELSLSGSKLYGGYAKIAGCPGSECFAIAIQISLVLIGP